jgi:hypothetical protein
VFVPGLARLLVLVPRLARSLVLIPGLVTILVFVVRMVIIHVRIVVVVVVVVVLVCVLSSSMFDMNSMSMSLEVPDGLSDCSLKLGQRLLLYIVQRGSIQNTEGADEIGDRQESRAEGRNLVDGREDTSQRPFLDRTGLVAEGQDIESRSIGSDTPDGITNGSLKLRDDLLLKVGQRSGGVRPDPNRQEEIREGGERVTQTREAAKRRKRILNLIVLKRPRRKWRKGNVGRKVCNNAASSIVKRVVELIKDRLLNSGKGDAIGDGVHADSVEEVRNRSKDISERRSIVERLDVNDLVPPDI